MKMIILFSDNPQANPEIRNTHMPDHLTFLEKNSAQSLPPGRLWRRMAPSAAGSGWSRWQIGAPPLR
jgi:hypothetical protein